MKKKCIACHKEVEIPSISHTTCSACVDAVLDELYWPCKLSTEVPKPLSEISCLHTKIRELRYQLKHRSLGYRQARHNRSVAAKLAWKKRKTKAKLAS